LTLRCAGVICATSCLPNNGSACAFPGTTCNAFGSQCWLDSGQPCGAGSLPCLSGVCTGGVCQ
jgi:hypothetical protein